MYESFREQNETVQKGILRAVTAENSHTKAITLKNNKLILDMQRRLTEIQDLMAELIKDYKTTQLQ